MSFKVRAVAAALGSVALMTVAVVVMAALRLAALGGARRLCAEGVARTAARACLWMAGVRVVLHRAAPLPAGQVIYTANHGSVLDLLVLLALGLPRTRFFVDRATLGVPLVSAVAVAVGSFFTPPQGDREGRVRSFKAACGKLRQGGDSACLGPDAAAGGSVHFSKGPFHLATELRAPVVPLFLHLPRAMRGQGLLVEPCTAHVHVLPPIRTEGWRVEDLEQHAAYVRRMYEDFAAEVEV